MAQKKRVSLASVSFLAVLIATLVVLGLQSVIYAETYATLNEVTAGVERVVVRFSERYVETSLTFVVSNPSSFSSIQLKAVEISTFLNGVRLAYTSGSFFYAIEIASKASVRVILNFRVVADSELEVYMHALREGKWSWLFDSSVILLVSFKEARISTSGTYEGAELSP